MTGLQAALPREHYVDPGTHALERQRVLLREWTCAGRLDDLGLAGPEEVLRPNRMAAVELVGEAVLVTVDAEGALHAHANVCRHRGSQLVPVAEGEPLPPACDVKVVRCGYHSWTYGLDGRLIHAPHTEDVTDFAPNDFSLHPVGAETWGGFLWLHAAPASARPLMDSLGEIPQRLQRYPLARLVVGSRLTYDVRANWKVVAENYNECYHCGPVHPELCRLVPAFGGGGAGLEWEDGIPHRDGAWTFTMSGTSNRQPFPDLDEAERVRHKGELVYPNLMLSLSADHVAAFALTPLAVDRTRIVCDLLFAPEAVAAADFDPLDAADFWDLVNRQDWAVCESVQRGMSSRSYSGGWYAPMEDASLDIRRWLLPRLQSDADA